MISYKEALRSIRAGYDLMPCERKWYHLARSQDYGLEIRFNKLLDKLNPTQIAALKDHASPSRRN